MGGPARPFAGGTPGGLAVAPPHEVTITDVATDAVSLSRSRAHGSGRAAADLDALAAEAARARGSVDDALALAATWAPRLGRPGQGGTAHLWSALATVGAVDLAAARTLEPHLDAVAILDELDGRGPDPGSTWGVFAAEAPGARLEATRARGSDTTWVLRGVKPWCSLAAHLSHALVTAWVDDERALFAVALQQDAVTTGGGTWVARGLPTIRSTPIELDGATATRIGEPGWYLRRDGFAWGGIGVAAVWFGGAVGVARRLARQARERELDQVGQLHLGAVDVALHRARTVLADAARDVDAGHAAGADGATLALRVRTVVAEAAEEVLLRTDHALGPAPLVGEEEHAARTADLHLYLRQHHAERDVAALGRTLAERPTW